MSGRAAEDPLWLNLRGGPLLYQAFMDRWHGLVGRAGLTWTPTPHDLRHFYASHLLESGIPVTQVSRYLGHANATKTLTVYAHAIRENPANLLAAFDEHGWANVPATSG